MALGVSLRGQLATSSSSSSSKLRHPAIDKIQTDIHNARRINSTRVSFIPKDELDKVLTRESISEVISSMVNLSSCELDAELAALVDQIDTGDPRHQNTSRKRIFAILTMLDKPGSIVSFIDAGICDRHLPLEDHAYPRDKQLRYIEDDGSIAICPARCFNNSHTMSHTFQVLQWEYLAPSSSFAKGEVHHQEIQHLMPLPFIEGGSAPRDGGNSQVMRVVIHRSHHDLVSSSAYFRGGY